MTDKTADTPQSQSSTVSVPANFPGGIPGFEEHKSFVIESREDLHPFQWLKSTEDSSVSLPIINCLLLHKRVVPNLTKDHLRLLGNPENTQVEVYCVLHVDQEAGTITVNTKAPVIISIETRVGYQIFQDRPDLLMDEPLAALVADSEEQ
ncbi:MAG: flagellar assembly protein FliW [Candidatus Marinimicrobia bacterium]|nr:flagellar assembly protein FliW [Candidatus Neomarinimicrobiota bacterium]